MDRRYSVVVRPLLPWRWWGRSREWRRMAALEGGKACCQVSPFVRGERRWRVHKEHTKRDETCALGVPADVVKSAKRNNIPPAVAAAPTRAVSAARLQIWRHAAAASRGSGRQLLDQHSCSSFQGI